MKKNIFFLILLAVRTYPAEKHDLFYLDFSMGLTICDIRATDDNESLFKPVDNIHTSPGYDWGVDASIWLSHFLAFSSGIHYQKYSMNSDVTDVKFSDNPGTYTYKSSIDLAYVSVPLQLQIGKCFNKKHELNFTVGPAVSYLVESHDVWTINNKNVELSTSDNHWVDGIELPPIIEFNKWDLRFIADIGYFFRMATNGIGVSCKLQRSLRELLVKGPSGKAFLKSITPMLSYRRYF